MELRLIEVTRFSSFKFRYHPLPVSISCQSGISLTVFITRNKNYGLKAKREKEQREKEEIVMSTLIQLLKTGMLQHVSSNLSSKPQTNSNSLARG
jgi:hypothetical protein